MALTKSHAVPEASTASELNAYENLFHVRGLQINASIKSMHPVACEASEIQTVVSDPALQEAWQKQPVPNEKLGSVPDQGST